MFKDIPLFLSLSETFYLFKMFQFGERKLKNSNKNNGAQQVEFPVKLFRKSFCVLWFFLKSFLSNSALKAVFLVLFTLSLILSQHSLPRGALTKDIYLEIKL